MSRRLLKPCSQEGASGAFPLLFMVARSPPRLRPGARRAVAESGLRRDEVFLTTKLWTSNWGYDKARAAIRCSAFFCAGTAVDAGRGRGGPWAAGGAAARMQEERCAAAAAPTPTHTAACIAAPPCHPCPARRQSLAELQTPYADLLLLHAPGDPATRADTWRALEDAQREVWAGGGSQRAWWERGNM